MTFKVEKLDDNRYFIYVATAENVVFNSKSVADKVCAYLNSHAKKAQKVIDESEKRED